MLALGMGRVPEPGGFHSGLVEEAVSKDAALLKSCQYESTIQVAEMIKDEV